MNEPATPKPEVTVLLIAHNIADQLDACLRSVLNQDYPMERVEILLVDDRSTDGTARAAEEMGIPSMRVLRIREAPQKLTAQQAALDLGIGEARGDVILITDADGRVPRDWIREMTGHLGWRDGAVTGPVIYAGGLPILTGLLTINRLAHLTMYRWLNRHAVSTGVVGHNMAIRRDAYLETGGFPAIGFAPAADTALGAALCRTGWSIRYLTRPAVRSPVIRSPWDLYGWGRRRFPGASRWAMALILLLLVTNVALTAAAFWGSGLWLILLLVRWVAGIATLSVWTSQYGSFRSLHWIWLYEPVMTLLYILIGLAWVVAPRWRWAGVTYNRRGPDASATQPSTG